MSTIKWVSNFFDEPQEIGDPPDSGLLAGSPGGDTPLPESAQLLAVGTGPLEKFESPAPAPAAAHGPQPFAIIGTDDRAVVKEPDKRPWRMICQLIMTGQNGSSWLGTGWLAGPRTIATAGHNVLSKDLKGWARSIKITPARNGDATPPFGSLTSTQFSTTDKWQGSYEKPTSQREQDFDFAAIHLPESFEQDLGWFGVQALPNDELFDQLVNVAGYPLKAPPASPGIDYLYMNRDKIADVHDTRLDYLADTKGGQSGSPVFLLPDGVDQHPVVVGVHAYGIDDTKNYGPRITTDLAALLKSWIEHDDP